MSPILHAMLVYFLGEKKKIKNITNLSADFAKKIIRVNGNGHAFREATLSKLFCLSSVKVSALNRMALPFRVNPFSEES